ncbi:type II secretion system F family protein [Photorhabdus africana]|uniref:type II secretion system F family protein n=1 Tax=Photorhabdus africana TaxID=3097554 RepID=UPI002B4113A5|nr:type II secretion system F family protein [Photorhabdus sp. CRI-LC]
MREMSWVSRLRYVLVRHTFLPSYRIIFYEALRFLLENKIPLLKALRQIRDVYTHFDTHWHPFAELIDDCISALTDNSQTNTLEHVLAVWGPVEEAALISAGMRSGHLPEALSQAMTLIGCRQRILIVSLRMMIYPLLLVLLMAGLLVITATELVPMLRNIADPENWQGVLAWLNGMATFFEHAFLWCGVLLLSFIVGVAYSLPRWVNRLRRIADHLIPWSVYSDIQGAIFLLNMASLLRAQVQTLDALIILQRFASPWLQIRLESIADCVREGDHFGRALHHCGYDFPSKEAVNFLSLLTEGDGTSEMIGRYGERWLDQTIVRVNRRANLVMLCSLLLVVGAFMLILLAVMEIQSMANIMP